MITAKITIKPHLREYVIGKFCGCDESIPVKFPDIYDIYILIWDLLAKRPVNTPIDSGNLEIVLPERYGSKNPMYYNHIGYRSQRVIEKKIEVMMLAEFREYVELEK
jgi:hypothetical protein